MFSQKLSLLIGQKQFSVKRRIREESDVRPELEELADLVEDIRRHPEKDKLWKELREKRAHYEGNEFFPSGLMEYINAVIDARNVDDLFFTAREKFELQDQVEDAFNELEDMIDFYKGRR